MIPLSISNPLGVAIDLDDIMSLSDEWDVFKVMRPKKETDIFMVELGEHSGPWTVVMIDREKCFFVLGSTKLRLA